MAPPVSSPSPGLRDLGGPGVEPEPIEGSTALARAAQTQASRSEVPSTQVEHDEAKSPGVRARDANDRIADAVDTASDVLSGYVSDEDVKKAMAALGWLRPDELDRALAHLESAGLLDNMVSKLSPEQLLDLTRMLSSSGLFQWASAGGEAGKPVEGAPCLIAVHKKLPQSLQALAHDINLAIAKQYPALKLTEPGDQGGPLDIKQHPLLAWRDGFLGRELRHAEAFVHRYLAVTDIDSSVHQLRPGDSYTLSANGGAKIGVGAEGTKASVGPEVSVGVEVSRDEDGKGFTVSADAALLAKLSASAKLPKAAAAVGEFELGAGGKVEFKFKSADEAAKAAELLFEANTNPIRFAALAPARTGEIAHLVCAVSAIEIAGQAAAKLGLEEDAGHGLFGNEKTGAAELSGDAATTFRVEFEKGQPTTLISRTALQFEASLGKSNSWEAGPFTAEFGKAVGVSVGVEIERRTKIAQGQSLKDAQASAPEAPAAMTVTLEAKKSGAFGESGSELEFKLEGQPWFLLETASALARHDVLTAASAIEKAEVTTTRTASSGLSLSVEVEAGGNGASLGLTAMRKRQLSKRTEEGTGREMALRLLRSLTEPQGPDTPTRVQIPSIRPD
ncbi:MAG: hypothetical protein IT380_22955 [Myxococcales bacterium]|nr:hypothetical protein [Myxococcales bacterium]